MRMVIRAILCAALSPGELSALNALRLERAAAARHRKGLRQIRRRSLRRPARLNLGCGEARKDGFLNIDICAGGDLTLDLRRGLPFESDCCEQIFSEHFFEHLDYPEPVSSLFSECLRVLRPGGEMRFSVPDTQWPLFDYGDGPDAPYFAACRQQAWHPGCETRLEHINHHFRQGHEHRYAYDFETVYKALSMTGFDAVQQCAFDSRLDSAHHSIGSLFVSARKPAVRGGG